MVKKDGMILEHTSYRRNRVAENIPFSAESNKRVCHKSVTHPFFVCFCIF